MGLFGLTEKERKLLSRLDPGTPVKVCFPKTYEAFQSKVEKIGSDAIYISAPKAGNAFLEIEKGTRLKLELEVYRRSVARMSFQTRVIDHNWAQGETVKLCLPRKLLLRESRRYYRIEVALPAEFILVEDKNNRSRDVTAPYFTGTIKNISESGALIQVEKLMSIEQGALLNLQVRLKDKQLLKIRAGVLHIHPVQGKFGIGVQFLFMNSNGRGQLREYISLQRKQIPDF